jgi:multisubunit Na+/H+ antiporter MnhB subunit
MKRDIRELDDIDLLLYVAMGPEPRSLRRLVELVAVAGAVLVGLAVFVAWMWAFR